MIVSPNSAAIAASPPAGLAKLNEVPIRPVRVEAAAALQLIRKAIINDPTVARQLDLAA